MQVSKVLGRAEGRYFHWCPGCDLMHPLPDRWTFDGNLETPTFSPSFRHTLVNVAGAGDVCHYILTAGQLHFCTDSTHKLAGQTVPLPPLPDGLTDNLEDQKP